MRKKEIRSVIDYFNSGGKGKQIISQVIGANVIYGMVWLDLDYHNLADNSPFKFYFITNDLGLCIGAVLDMNTNLHWYISPKCRKQGLLSNALINCILPHLSGFKKEQRITINRDQIGNDNFAASLATAKKSGFKIEDETINEIQASQKLFKYKHIPVKTVNEGMNFEDMVELRKKVNNAAGQLMHVQAELEMKLGASPGSQKLKKMIEELRSLSVRKLDDMLYDFNDVP